MASVCSPVLCVPEHTDAFVKSKRKPDIRYRSYHDSCLFVADISVALISTRALR